MIPFLSTCMGRWVCPDRGCKITANHHACESCFLALDMILALLKISERLEPEFRK